MSALKSLRKVDIFDLNPILNELAVEIKEHKRVVNRVKCKKIGSVALFWVGRADARQKTRRIRTFW